VKAEKSSRRQRAGERGAASPCGRRRLKNGKEDLIMLRIVTGTDARVYVTLLL
jgi:hypothetical protein